MDLSVILITIIFCLFYRIAFGKKHIEWFIFISSIACLYYFQPISGIRYYDFWIPSISLLLAIIIWLIVTDIKIIQSKQTKATLLVLIGFFITFIIFRQLPRSVYLKFTNIPGTYAILIFLLLSFFGCFIVEKTKNKPVKNSILIIGLILVFIIIKNEKLSLISSQILRSVNNQSLENANHNEIIWIGYSYFAFRLMHVLIDIKNPQTNTMSLKLFIGYVLYFPALLAGPIMRQNDFNKAVNETLDERDQFLFFSFRRIAIGLFLKFVLADQLAIVSINPDLINITISSGWMWVFVILYSFRIFFDFAGYTHIVIGISQIIGIRLPENFNQPLLAPNITMFWNRWHMTLTQWFRAYYFNPLTRKLRRRFRHWNQKIILAFMQISTMVLIGLWHGISWNFVLWGLWNGVGLYTQNQLSTYYKKNDPSGKSFWQRNKIFQGLSVIFTFMFISLGWVWFAMPDVPASITVFETLFGLN